MAKEPRPIVISGPYKGIEWSESKQTPQTCELAINVDFSGGRIEARKGLKVISVGFLPTRGQLWLTETSPQYILMCGPAYITGVPGEIQCAVFDADGALNSMVGYLSQDFFEPYVADLDYRFECSFVNTSLLVNGMARNVTLISTSYNTYVFDPGIPPGGGTSGGFRKLAPSTDKIGLNSANFGYWVTPPHGTITATHLSSVWYAGFRDHGDSAILTSTLESSQNLVPEVLINTGRTSLELPPWAICYSDSYDPAGVQAHHIFGVPDQERVTGLKSFQEALAIFTDKHIYALTGGTDAEFRIIKTVAGVGCVAPRSVIEVGGILYFMSSDGIHAYAGAGTMVAPKISTPIDALFSGRWDRSRYPEEIQTKLGTLGFPWTVAHADLRYSQAVHYQERNQIWWSVPVQSRANGSFAITIVYDYVLSAWSIWTPTPGARTGGAGASCMYSGVSVRGRGPETIYTTNGVGGTSSAGGELQRYGWYRDGTSTSSDWFGVPMIWLSSRFFADNENQLQVRPVFLKMLSTGSTPGTNPPRWMMEGEKAHTDYGQTERQQQSGNLATLPTGTVQAQWNTGNWNTIKWSSIDWFDNKVEASCSSKSLRFGVIDDAVGQDRGNLVVIESLILEVKSGNSR